MLEGTWPLPTLQHLCRLTDDCGVIQHAKFWLPDYATGYCVDDNSRALIVALKYYRIFGDATAHELMVRYLAFILYTQRRDGKIRNFIDFTRAYLEDEGSPDSLARTIWALGSVSTIGIEYLEIPAREMLSRAISHLSATSPPHAQAYGILGMCAFGEEDTLRAEAQHHVRPLASALLDRYMATHSEEWQWFSPVLTYGNARMPEALLRAGQLIDSPDFTAIGLESLNFLNSVCFSDGYLSVVGCHGWYPQEGRRAIFDQQPIDAGGMVEANLVAYQVTGDQQFFDFAVRAMNWFYGENVLKTSVYNPRSGGCHDGLHSQGVNENQGAESTLAYLMAQLSMYQAAPHLFQSCEPPQSPASE